MSFDNESSFPLREIAQRNDFARDEFDENIE